MPRIAVVAFNRMSCALADYVPLCWENFGKSAPIICEKYTFSYVTPCQAPQPNLFAFRRRIGSGREWAWQEIVGGRCPSCHHKHLLLFITLPLLTGF